MNEQDPITPSSTGPVSGEPPAAPKVPPAIDAPLHAARDAAAYVERLFSEMDAPEPGGEDTGPGVLEQPEIAADAPPTPVIEPAQAMAQLLAGRKVLVLGLGISGLSMARWCVRCGAEVTVADTRAEPPLLSRLRDELPQVPFVCGAFDATLVDGKDLDRVLYSPGLSPVDVAPITIAINQYGISGGAELSLYSEALGALREACGYAPHVLAVTGTNGKTTVTALTGQLVERAGRSVAVAGNIGPAMLDTLAERIDACALPDVWVLELSSFQLNLPSGFEPTAATVLNLTQDHLDWHGDMAAYGAAKARIFGRNGLMVLNRDDDAVLRMRGESVAPDAPTSGPRAKPARPVAREWVSFGADMPSRPGDFGIESGGGMAWLVRAQEADETRKRASRRAALAQADAPELFIQRLMPADALRIRGRHNAMNALAALALAQAAGCALAPMLYGLREYRGEPHRVEPVAIIDGVEYFDDSKGTNVGATVAAIAGLGAERRVVVILGGVGKGQDFAPLAAPVARHVRAVVLIGRDAPQIRAALAGTGVAMLDAATLEDAVAQAASRAHAGDAVLLSPACASFDMFDSYVHRGERFCAIVRERAHDAGQSTEGAA